jgi:hypothetical protein
VTSAGIRTLPLPPGTHAGLRTLRIHCGINNSPF